MLRGAWSEGRLQRRQMACLSAVYNGQFPGTHGATPPTGPPGRLPERVSSCVAGVTQHMSSALPTICQGATKKHASFKVS